MQYDHINSFAQTNVPTDESRRSGIAAREIESEQRIVPVRRDRAILAMDNIKKSRIRFYDIQGSLARGLEVKIRSGSGAPFRRNVLNFEYLKRVVNFHNKKT